jgi:hypothetical protein
MRVHLVVAAAVLIAGLAFYRSEAEDRRVASSLEALRHESGSLHVSEVRDSPSAPEAAPVQARPSHALPPLDAREEGSVSSPRREGVARPPSDGLGERPSGRGWVSDGHARPGLSRAALDRVEDRRRASEPTRQLQRLARLESPDPEERANAVFGLDAEDEEELAALTTAIEDPDASVRVEAVRRLQFARPDAAVPLLVDALSDSNAAIVLEAIDSLKFAGESTAIPDLEPLLESPNPRVRSEAYLAIERLR